MYCGHHSSTASWLTRGEISMISDERAYFHKRLIAFSRAFEHIVNSSCIFNVNVLQFDCLMMQCRPACTAE